jgi:hypothetical protein
MQNPQNASINNFFIALVLKFSTKIHAYIYYPNNICDIFKIKMGRQFSPDIKTWKYGNYLPDLFKRKTSTIQNKADRKAMSSQ